MVLSAQTVSTQEPLALFSNEELSFTYNTAELSVKEEAGQVQVSLKAGFDPSQASARLTITAGGNTPPKNSSDADSILLSGIKESIAGTEVQKNTYQQIINLGGRDYDTYYVEWAGASDTGLALSIKVEGLYGAPTIPSVFSGVLDSLSLGPGGRVLGSKQSIPANYTIDLISPGVVKIYRITCGTLMVDGNPVGEDRCDASSGSGFLVSSEGHIATSGHVVTREAEDALVEVLLSNASSLTNFLKYMGLSDQQIYVVGSRPELLAAVIARLYDTPSNTINFQNQRSALIVSLGSRPLALNSEQDARNLLSFNDTDHVKKADLVASNYSAKDLFVLVSDSEEGFSASDVALIKINSENTPYLELATDNVTQNQKISILGFPGDADNMLTDNNSLNVTTTNGSISAVRLAAGSIYKLYQSDADASQGNSGGPVVAEDGKALGILTYRYKNAASSDAAKSYIRDIEDVKKLSRDNNITLTKSGATQEGWLRGLKLFSENRFTKAIAEFEKVQSAYPAHRLSASYIKAAEQGIKDGHDVKDIPLAVAATISFIGAAGASVAIILIARHHTKHLAYKLANSRHTFTPHHANT